MKFRKIYLGRFLIESNLETFIKVLDDRINIFHDYGRISLFKKYNEVIFSGISYVLITMLTKLNSTLTVASAIYEKCTKTILTKYFLRATTFQSSQKLF